MYTIVKDSARLVKDHLATLTTEVREATAKKSNRTPYYLDFKEMAKLGSQQR